MNKQTIESNATYKAFSSKPAPGHSLYLVDRPTFKPMRLHYESSALTTQQKVVWGLVFHEWLFCGVAFFEVFVHSGVQYSTVQCSAVQWSKVQWSTVQRSKVFLSTVQYMIVQESAVKYSWVCYLDQCRAEQYSTVHYPTVQYSTVQYSTVQYSTVQYSTVHYRTVHCAMNREQCQTKTYNSTVQLSLPPGPEGSSIAGSWAPLGEAVIKR